MSALSIREEQERALAVALLPPPAVERLSGAPGKIHRTTDDGRAVCGMTRNLPGRSLHLTADESTITCTRCQRMLRLVGWIDRRRAG